jgi:hypothetical protein
MAKEDKTPKQPKLSLVRNSSSFDLVIPEEVEAKIRHLCSKVHDVEWSGTLFYTVEGSLDDGTFKATCLDICVMDIGTGGYTEFKDTEDIIAYRLEHRDTLLQEGVYEALIHSHNNMSAFFSGTDENTLIEEGSDLNHFLSLIVCNAGHYVARITRKLKSKIKAEAHIVYTKNSQYNTYNNETIVLADEETSEVDKVEERESVVIEYFELNINKAEVEEPFKEIDERLDEIKTRKAKPKTKYASYYSSYYQNWRDSDEDGMEFTGLEHHVPEGRQLAMFGHEEENNEEEETPAIELSPAEFYLTEKVPQKIIKTLCTQLLFGSILANGEADIDLPKFVKRMDKAYEHRFGNLVDQFTYFRLSNWIEVLLEQLISYSVDKDYEDKIAKKYNLGDDYEYEESDAFIHLYAHGMILYLRTLPESDVKDMMIEGLINMMPKGYGDLDKYQANVQD